MPRKCFTALLGLLHVSDPDDLSEELRGKHCKVSWLLQHTNQASATYFEPHRDMSMEKSGKIKSSLRNLTIRTEENDGVGLQALDHIAWLLTLSAARIQSFYE